MGRFQNVIRSDVVFLKDRSWDHSFSHYINDLPNSLSYCTPRMFTVDTTLTAWGKSSQDLSFAMNHELKNAKDCLMANKLCLNLSKTKYML